MMGLNEMKDVIRDVEEFMYKNGLTERDLDNIISDYMEDCKYIDNFYYSYYDMIGNYIICDIKDIDETKLYDYLDEYTYSNNILFYTFISGDRLYLNICEAYEEKECPFKIVCDGR